ncbi:MAG TPA: DegQ family serine endoprotease [Pyrinomonadaceae bacterium]|nr:DegQ family serine endoprotease [Pyrinomonadaceae bacterium]
MSRRTDLSHASRGAGAPRLRVALLALALLSGGLFTTAPAASVASPADSAAEPSPAAQQSSYADAVQRVTPAVVTVRSERRARPSQQFPFMDDPRFREFFGQRSPRGEQEPRGERASGLGSGVIVSTDGYILTNHHVIDGAEQITIETSDDRTFRARLVGSDPPSDLAVLKIDSTNLPVLTLANSDEVRVGDVVLAVGNPLGVGQTVTQGIISAKGRQTGLGDGSFEDFIQTDAPINRGNSGGALVNTTGELVGINSQILSPSGGSIGIGFAIPSNMARNVMQQLITTGRVRRGVLGIYGQPLSADLAASFGLEQARGALVSEVQPDSPAAAAGVRRGDVIIAVNGQAVADYNALRNRIAATQPGTAVTLRVLRDGREQQLRATLGEREVETTREGGEENAPGGERAAGGRLGLSVEPLTPESAQRLNLPAGTRGLLVTSVTSGGPASEAGLRRGDLIQEVNRQPVNTREELTAAVGRAGDRPVLLLVTREGRNSYLAVRPRR